MPSSNSKSPWLSPVVAEWGRGLYVCLFCFWFFWFLGFGVFGGGGVQDSVSLCSPSCPGTHSVDQADLELRNSPASASQVLGLKACATTAQHEPLLKPITKPFQRLQQALLKASALHLPDLTHPPLFVL